MSLFEEELTSLSIPFSAQIISKCAQQQATCVMHLLYEQRGETAWKEFGFSDTACRMLLDLQELVHDHCLVLSNPLSPAHVNQARLHQNETKRASRLGVARGSGGGGGGGGLPDRNVIMPRPTYARPSGGRGTSVLNEDLLYTTAKAVVHDKSKPYAQTDADKTYQMQKEQASQLALKQMLEPASLSTEEETFLKEFSATTKRREVAALQTKTGAKVSDNRKSPKPGNFSVNVLYLDVSDTPTWGVSEMSERLLSVTRR